MGRDDYLDAVESSARAFGHDAVLAAVASGVAARLGAGRDGGPLARSISPGWIADDALVESLRPPDVRARPGLLGLVHEHLTSASDRKRRGVHYTPKRLADGLVALALDGANVPGSICDPTVGGGSFLLASAEWLRSAGVHPNEIVTQRLFGADIDETARAVARVELALWALEHTGVAVQVPEGHVVVADTLVTGRSAWARMPDGFDVVVGNPPFRSQLRERSARTPAEGRAITARLGIGAAGYVDEAGLFLVASCDLVARSGRVLLVLPQSLLAARDATEVRQAVGTRGALSAVWVGNDLEFGASVRVWAPLVQLDDHDPGLERPVRRFIGSEVTPTTAAPSARLDSSSWAPLVSDLVGGIDLDVEQECSTERESLGSLATATSGFRQQFYGLIPFVGESTVDDDLERWAPLVTVGAIDPLRNRWGGAPVRFGGRRWLRPAVDREALAVGAPSLAAWVTHRLVPKVLVAPQSRVLEVVVDPTGVLVPSTPVVSVEPVSRDAHAAARVAAVLASPVASAWAFRRGAGSGLGASTVRTPPRLLLEIPLPTGGHDWDAAASLVLDASRAADAGDELAWEAALDGVAVAMTEAYGLSGDHAVVSWWRSRRPGWRG